MTYMRSWKSLRLTSHTWLGLNPQIGRPLSRIIVPLVYFFKPRIKYTQLCISKTQYSDDIELQNNQPILIYTPKKIIIATQIRL
jgi:hypothetical protein